MTCASPAGADAGHAVTLVAQPGLDRLFLGGGAQPGQVSGVFKPDAYIVGFQGVAFYTRSRVGPSARPTMTRASPQHFFSSGGQVAGGEGVGNEARQGRLGKDGKLAGGGQAGAHQGTAHEQAGDFPAPEGRPRGTVAVKQVSPQPDAADEAAQGVARQSHPSGGYAGGQVNYQGFAVVTVHFQLRIEN